MLFDSYCTYEKRKLAREIYYRYSHLVPAHERMRAFLIVKNSQEPEILEERLLRLIHAETFPCVGQEVREKENVLQSLRAKVKTNGLNVPYEEYDPDFLGYWAIGMRILEGE